MVIRAPLMATSIPQVVDIIPVNAANIQPATQAKLFIVNKFQPI